MSTHPTNHESFDNIQLHQSAYKRQISPVQQKQITCKKLSTANLSVGFYKALEDQPLANPLLVTEHYYCLHKINWGKAVLARFIWLFITN